MIDKALEISNAHLLLNEYRNYLIIKQYAKNTLSIYMDVIDEFIYFLGKNKYYHFSQIDKNTFYRYISFIKSLSSLSNRTININIASINNFSDFLCKYYKSCELQKIRQLKFISTTPNILDEKDMLLLLKIKNPIYDKAAMWTAYRDFALGVLLYSSGARISEALNIESININEEWIRLEETKNKKTRYIPINTYTHIAINNYKEQCPFFLYKNLWICTKGKKFKATAASAAIKRMFGYSPHYFRHAFATHLILNGCELLIVKEFLGHSSIATTSIYTHIKQKHLKKTVEQCHPMSSQKFF